MMSVSNLHHQQQQSEKPQITLNENMFNMLRQCFYNYLFLQRLHLATMVWLTLEK